MTKSVQHPQKPKSAAQRASEANRLQQVAVRDQTARPSDRRNSDAATAPDHKI